MVEVNTSFVDFSSGEASPNIRGRFDLAAYYKSGRRVENFVPLTTGSAQFRRGFLFDAQTRLNQKAFLWQFNYSDTISYVLEFTAQKIRFFGDSGRVHATGQNITNITKANPAVVTYAGSDTYANGDSVFISGALGMTEVNGRDFIVANVNVGANTFELSGVNSSAYGAYVSGGTVEEIIEVASPYAEADLFGLKFAQQGLNLYIVHPSYQPQKLTYVGTTSWSMAAHAPIREEFGNYQAITAITKANPAVVTYTGADSFSNGDRIKITGVSGMTEVNDTIFRVANVNVGANTFELQDEDSVNIDSTGYTTYSSGGIIREIISSAVPFLSAGEYPGAVATYEQRLVYGGSNNKPTTLYFSRAADFDDFTIGTEVDDGMEYVVTGDIGRIVWLRGAEKFLAIGGYSDIGQVTGGIDNVLTPTSVSVKQSNSFGAANIMPFGRGNQIYYLQNNGLVVRSFQYDFQSDTYVPLDLMTISEHMTAGGITQMAFQEGRPNILWGIRLDGQMIGLTTEEGESITGWHRSVTDGEFVSVASLARAGAYDQLLVCVKRDGNYHMERMAEAAQYPDIKDYININGTKSEDYNKYRNVLFEAQKEYIHLDCCSTYRGDQLTGTLTPAAVTGVGVTFTASDANFTADMVGRELHRKSVTGAETGRAEITGYTSATQVTCDIVEDFNSVTAIPQGEWYLTADSVSGLWYLEGKTVQIVADGALQTEQTVVNGTVSLPTHASVIHVGLGYSGYLETNDIEGGGVTGTAQTKRKNVYAVGFRFLDTLYAMFGVDYYDMKQVEARTVGMRTDRPPELFSGDLREDCHDSLIDSRDGGWSREKRAIVVQDLPFPCTVQLIVPYMTVSN